MCRNKVRLPMKGASTLRPRSSSSWAVFFAVIILLFTSSDKPCAESGDFLASDWGSGFQSCAGARTPMAFRAAGPDSNVEATGVITCRDDGDAFVYAVDYMNFVLNPSGNWTSAYLQWFGAGAQRQGANGRNDWFYDEARPIRVQIAAPGQRVAISSIAFRVPKSVLTRARGFGFYAVGGGIFWPIHLQSRIENPVTSRAAPQVETAAPIVPVIVPSNQSSAGGKPDLSKAASDAAIVPVERAEWGAGFPTCAGARSPMPFKAATASNDTLLGNGIVTCVDDGDAYVYAVDYMNFSLAAASKRSSANLEWFGCGAQRSGTNGRNDWIFDETMPINAHVKAGVERVSVSQLSCRVPKSVLARARGFGFYVVGGGTLWSILLL